MDKITEFSFVYVKIASSHGKLYTAVVNKCILNWFARVFTNMHTHYHTKYLFIC